MRVREPPRTGIAPPTRQPLTSQGHSVPSGRSLRGSRLEDVLRFQHQPAAGGGCPCLRAPGRARTWMRARLAIDTAATDNPVSGQVNRGPCCRAPQSAATSDPGIAPLATASCWSSVPVAVTPHPIIPPSSFDEMAGADPESALAAGTNQACPLPLGSRTVKNQPTGMRGSPAPGQPEKGADWQSERLYAPLVPPGRCPLYVRNHCYASTRSDTP